MTTQIHPTAIIEDGALIGNDVVIGPYCCVGPNVIIGSGTRLISHVVIGGNTTIGSGNVFFPFCSIGLIPQDLKFKGEKSKLVIGNHNTIREHVTMNPGTEGGGLLTEIGNHCLFMVGSHVAHDCMVADHVILANNATLAGHVSVDEFAIIGGLAAVHQFTRIGKHAMIGGMSGVENDVIPYGSVIGERARLSGLNIVGLKRRGFSREQVHRLRAAYKELFDLDGTLADRLVSVRQSYQDDLVIQDILGFIDINSSRSLCQPKRQSED